MSSVSIQAIKELRERTQAGMADCKKALQSSEGDMDKAVEFILKRGQAKSAKRAGKIAAEGEVRTELFDDGRTAAIAEVNIETDFSARNEHFKTLVGKVMAAAKTADLGSDLGAFEVEGKPLTQHASELTAIVGEKITLRRFGRLNVPKGTPGFCHSYVHMGGKIGVVVALETDTDGVAKHEAVTSIADEVAMHVAAMNPMALRRDDLDQAMVAKQKEIYEAQLRDDPKPKPEKIWPKIIEGKINSWFSEVALLDQQSPNPDHGKKTIAQLLEDVGKTAGGSVSIAAFVRYELGEGIEKKQEDLTAGVAELLNQ